MSRIIGVLLVEKELNRRSSWQANNAISPEQNIFSEVYTIQIFKSLQETVYRLTLDIQTRYVALSAITDRQIHRYIDTDNQVL